jgi:hypothetical protein
LVASTFFFTPLANVFFIVAGFIFGAQDIDRNASEAYS